MQTDVADKISRTVLLLPPEKQEEVLEFVTGLVPVQKNIWEHLDELMSSVPQEEIDEIPSDAAGNIDHYLYGASKK